MNVGPATFNAVAAGVYLFFKEQNNSSENLEIRIVQGLIFCGRSHVEPNSQGTPVGVLLVVEALYTVNH